MIATYIIIAAIAVILGTWEKSPFRVYWKTEAGRAFVRTGLGGAKPIIGGGAFVIPLLHKIQWVDLGETKLVVSRRDKESIITRDHLRVDLEAEFYVRVKADRESVLQASITLGRRAQSAEALRDFLEPNLLDSLQAVGSEMTLDEIHDQRISFARRVHELLAEDLRRKGLELTSVSLTSFDQTRLEFYDPDNVFDSEGLLAIKEQTERRRKARNDIEREQALLIEEKNVEVRKRALDLERERAFAEQDARKEIEAQKEERERELTQFRFDQRRLSEEARIVYDQDLKDRELVKERYLEEQRLAKERAVELAEIAKRRELEEERIDSERSIQTAAIQREINLAGEKRKREETLIDLERVIEVLRIEKDKYLERERIAKELEVEVAEIDKRNKAAEEQVEKDKSVHLKEVRSETELILERQKQELADLDKTRAVELAKRTREVAIAGQEKAIAQARTETTRARTEQEEAEQEMMAVKVRSQAERQKVAAVIRAEEEAARARIEKETAVGLDAYQITQIAAARLEAAGNDARAIQSLSEARGQEAMINARSERAMVEARNLTAEHILKNERISQLIGELAKIAGELMKPAEKIESIKVVHVDGLGGQPVAGGVGLVEGEQSILSNAGAQSAIATIINGILQVGAFRPVFRQLFGEDGIGELEYGRFVQMLKEIAPGLLTQTGREVVRTALQEEQGRKAEVKKKKKKAEKND